MMHGDYDNDDDDDDLLDTAAGTARLWLDQVPSSTALHSD
jgi:hypothetical protein